MKKSLILFVSAIMLFACEKQEYTSSKSKTISVADLLKTPVAVPETIWGEWMFIGFGHVKTAEIEIIDDQCANCYTLNLDSEGVIAGRSSVNDIYGTFVHKENDVIQELIIKSLGGTKIKETDKGERYIQALRAVSNYTNSELGLQLHYSDSEFLLYRIPRFCCQPIQQ